jgi:hypothetical protein
MLSGFSLEVIGRFRRVVYVELKSCMPLIPGIVWFFCERIVCKENSFWIHLKGVTRRTGIIGG